VEFSSETVTALDGVLELIKSDIPLDGHETHAHGKLVEFLQDLFPDREFRIVPLFRALLSEVTARNNNREDNVSYEDLVRRKGLSRGRFTEVLQEAGVSEVRVDLQEVTQRLSTESCPFGFVAALRREWDAVQLDRLTKRDIPYLRLREAIRSAISVHLDQPRLIDLMERCYKSVIPELRKEWGFSEMYVKTCIALEAYERQ
jgi:hypothetical protein